MRDVRRLSGGFHLQTFLAGLLVGALLVAVQRSHRTAAPAVREVLTAQTASTGWSGVDAVRSAAAPRPARRIWIDGGANCANSWRFMLAKWADTLCPQCAVEHSNAEEFEAFLIEFNEDLWRRYLAPLQERDPRVRAMWNAVWVEDGVNVTGYHGKRFLHDACEGMHKYPDGAATMVATMQVADPANTFRVPSLDLSRWIDDHFAVDDFVALKLDIEGAEWQVLRKLITDGVLCRKVDWLAVELHTEPDLRSEGMSLKDDHAARVLDWMLRTRGCPELRRWE